MNQLRLRQFQDCERFLQRRAERRATPLPPHRGQPCEALWTSRQHAVAVTQQPRLEPVQPQRRSMRDGALDQRRVVLMAVVDQQHTQQLRREEPERQRVQVVRVQHEVASPQGQHLPQAPAPEARQFARERQRRVERAGAPVAHDAPPLGLRFAVAIAVAVPRQQRYLVSKRGERSGGVGDDWLGLRTASEAGAQHHDMRHAAGACAG